MKLEGDESHELFIQKIEKTLFDLLDDDDPVNIYMLTDICKQLGLDANYYFPEAYQPGSYNLKAVTKGDLNISLRVIETLYQTCIRFQKFELALIVNSEVTRALMKDGAPKLKWVDGSFRSA